METLIGLALTDASLLEAFADGHRDTLDLGAPHRAVDAHHGTWGVGFHAHGELLVRKGPLAALDGGLGPLLRGVRARHLMLYARAGGDAAQRPGRLEEQPPLRYRDWLFAAHGADTLGPGFAAEVQALLPTYAFASRPHPRADEALMMLAMNALERCNARDTRDLTTRAIRRAVAMTASEVQAMAPAARVLVLLHVAGHLFAFTVGRELYALRLRGTGEPDRPGRPGRHEHLRALVIGDRTQGGPWDSIGPDLGVEVDAACELHTFPLR